MNSRFKPISHIFAIIILTALAYSNTFSSSFHFDDRYAIFEDMAIRDMANLPKIVLDIFNRPLLRITFAINYYFGGIDVFGYHLVNILLHIFVSLSVYILTELLFRRLSGDNPAFNKRVEGDSRFFALLSSLLFALHPVHTGSVTYIASRSSVLAALFYITAVILFIMAYEYNSKSFKGVILHSVALFTFILGWGVKETVLTVPFIIALILFFKTTVKGRGINRRDIILLAMWLLTIPLYALIRYSAVQYVIPVDTRFGPSEILPPYQYLLTELNVVVFHYLKWFFFPVGGPHVDPDIPSEISFMDGSTIAASIILTALIYIAVRSIKRAPIVSFGIFWYFITLLPTSSIFPIADVAVERHLYLPSIGLALIGAYLLLRLRRSLPDRIGFITYLIPVLIVIITIKTNLIWKNEVTLWEDAARKSPDKVRTLSNRAFAYFEAGDTHKAEILYLDFIRRFPDDPFGHNNIALIYGKMGDIDLSIKHYKEAVRLKPEYWRFHMHLGNAYSKTALFPEAVNEFETAINLDPSNPEPMIMLASLLAKNGEIDKVIALANRALLIEPKNAMAYSLLGISYERKGLREDAIRSYKKALELNPGWGPLIEKLNGMTGGSS